jgi:DNA-binding winged helix-turn-helix (wHTH) protein/tetratricopeptide (TPR) repeat protein
VTQSLIIRAGSCEIDVGTHELRVAGQPCAVEPRVFSLLVYLAQRPDRVVTRQELLQGVWPGRPVSDAALARAVMKARQALGDASDSSPIRTVPRVGYRFVAERAELPADPLAISVRRLAILPFDNDTGEPSLDWVSLGLMSLVAAGIEREPGLDTVPISAVLVALDSARAAGADPPASVRAATGAGLVVGGKVTHSNAGYRLTLECVDVGSVEVEAATPGELGPEGVRALAGLLRPGSDGALPVHDAPNPLATTAFARALQAQAQDRYPEAANLLRMADMLSPGSTPVRLELLRALCGTGELAPARPIARGLLAEAQRRHDGLLTARVHRALACAHAYAQAFEPAIDHIEQCLYWLGDQGPAEEVARTYLMLAKLAIVMGDHAACDVALERMRQPCEASGNRLLRISLRTTQAHLARARGDRARAAELTVQLLDGAQDLRLVREVMAAASSLSEDLVLIGRWSEAAAYAEQAFAAAVQSKDRVSICSAVVNGSWTYMVLGVPAAAERLVQALPADAELSALEQLWAVNARGHAAASAGRHAQAAGFFIETFRLLRSKGNRLNEGETLPWLLRSLVHCGRLDEAESELAAARPHVGGSGQGVLMHCEALLAHSRGRPEQGLQCLRQAMSYPTLPPLWTAWIVLDAAWLLAEAGRGGEALAMLERLPKGFDELPLTSAVTARVHLSLGAYDAARRCHSTYRAAARHGHLPRFLAALGDCCTEHGLASPAPCLPSRL